jgi:hypothetical protein
MSVKVSFKRFLKESSAEYKLNKQGDKIAMAAVLVGPQEVLVIMIVTAIVVFLVVRGRKNR